MDFFEAQARAKKRTSRLLVLFGLAVAGTILATYFAAVMGLHGSRTYRTPDVGSVRWIRGNADAPAGPSLWQPQLFGLISIATLVVVGGAALYKWQQYSAGGSAVAENLDGRRVEPNTTDLAERRLLNVVEEMAIASGVPVPTVYILDQETGINAFAAGLTTSDAVVAVTRGTLDKLTRDELQGVIGHEFSHILNGDMRLNVRIAAVVFGILVLGLLGRGILWSLRGTRVRGKGGSAILAVALIGLALMIIGYIGYFFGRLIQAAVSRQREFLADASAVQFTRNPLGLAGALKKIGGYALGSLMVSNKSGEIGHFFFAQGFRSGFTGLWDTHPPLDERVRAIDPSFDGKFFEPPERVDVAHESFAAAGLAGPAAGKLQTPTTKLQTSDFGPPLGGETRPPPPFGSDLVGGTRPPPRQARGLEPVETAGAFDGAADGARPPSPSLRRAENFPPRRSPQGEDGKSPSTPTHAAVQAVAAVGSLTPEQIDNAQSLLDATPPRLRDASRSAIEAPVLVFALLLADDPTTRSRQRDLIAQHCDADVVKVLGELEPALAGLRDEQRLPLLQLALPALRGIAPDSLAAFLGTLDELVHADRQISAFEFALQKLLTRTLELGRTPSAAAVQYYSFNAVVDDIAIVLAALAHAATADPGFARQAFAAGAAQLKLIESRLRFRGAAESDFATLDAALDKLARASGPIKHRTLVAAAHVVTADGQLLVVEAELLRAISAALDVPMPPLQMHAPQAA